MPYARNGGISTADMSAVPGWVYISDEQYKQALDGMASGKVISVDDGFALIDKPADPDEPTPPDEPVKPQRCTRRQGRLALLQTPHGEVTKLDAAEAALEAIADPMQKRAAMIEYEADTWERSNAFLQAMWAQLGSTEEQLDALFTLAVTL